MKLEGKKVLVVGLGKTGNALCEFLSDKQARVKVSERKRTEELGGDVKFLKEKGISIEAGGHNPLSFLESDLIIPSPGVPYLPELEAAQNNGIPVISEIELAFRFLKGKIVGITGSNGKSTTATLTYKILKEGGIDAFLAGNIGTPLISFANSSQDKYVYVTELSSFQLEYIHRFFPSVAILLNLSPDHLDWHKNLEDYYSAKKKLITSQNKEGTAILNRDDDLVWPLAEQTQASVLAFSQNNLVEKGCSIQQNGIVLKNDKEEELMNVSEVPLLGKHNLDNVMSSALVGALFSIPISKIKESILHFKGLEHRLEKILDINGIIFVNDSKATNVEAAIKSIHSFEKNIILILGGRDKGGDFNKLSRPVEERVKKIILIGEARNHIQKILGGSASMDEALTMEEAIQKGYESAKSGDVVLLAPACTSFDMFRNFEERGRIFKKGVFALKEKIDHAQK